MNTSDSRKNKWIAGGAILIMLSAGGSVARTFHLQRQASNNDPKAQRAALEARMQLSPEEQAHRLELVTHLRETWKPWAKAHQTELRRMLAATPSDGAARDAVWGAIPNAPETSPDLKDYADALNPTGDKMKGEVFTWSPTSRGVSASQVNAMPADVKGRFSKSTSALNWALQDNFAAQHDIELSQSIQTGKVSVSLWASGRVTENTIRDETSVTSESVFIRNLLFCSGRAGQWWEPV